LQIGNPNAPLNWGIGLASQSAENKIHWYSHLPGNLPGVIHHTLPQWIAKRFWLRAILEPFYLASTIRKVDPDLVQVHYASKGLATLAIIKRKPLLVTTMGSDLVPNIGYRFPFRYWIDLILDRATLVTARSNFMKDRLLKMGVEERKIEVNSWGIDMDHFKRNRHTQKLKQKFGIDPEAFVFFDPRSANSLYNKDIIIRAFSKLVDNSSENTVLVIAAMFATADQLHGLKELVSQLGIESMVHFIGNIAYEEMPEWYSLSECTISVPSSDGMPQTIFEAWACGSFLIVGDLPQYNEFVEDGVSAKRVAIRDVEDLRLAMSWILENPEIRKDAVRIGREKAAHFADRKVQKEHYQEIVKRLLTTKSNESEIDAGRK
jgi:glycosyltransferase involved in cell wall biosynthesis